MKKQSKIPTTDSNNKPVFNSVEQRKVIEENTSLLNKFKNVKTVPEWNDTRDQVKKEFKGTPLQLLMLLGHIDGVHFPEIMIK